MASILNIVFIISVLFSSTGIVLLKHSCKRMEVEWATGEEIASCKDMGGCKKGCCSTHAKYFHLDQDQLLSQNEVYLTHFSAADAIYLTDKRVGKRHQDHQIHIPEPPSPPPLSHRDILVRFQVFRC